MPAGDCLVSQDLVEQLPHGAFGLKNRATMVHDSRQIGIGKRNATEGRSSQDFAGRRLSVLAEEKAGLRIEIGVPPAVQNDSRDIAPRIKTGAAKHFGKLLADFSFVIPERGCQHFSPAAVSLIGGRQSRDRNTTPSRAALPVSPG